ncbi:DNA polymerase zeta [Rhizophlyctis rosea]|nr:DNA polymerase zeta [Rhizophlyctis rosea]
MDRKFQTYDSHIPYLHQFFIDHNLYGMDYIHLADGRFRMPIHDMRRNENEVLESDVKLYTNQTVPPNKRWSRESGFHRQSFCELELDTTISDITNRFLIAERPQKALIDIINGTQSFGDTKLVPSLATIWKDEEQRRLARGLTQELFPSTPGALRSAYIPWTNEERLRTILQKALEEADAKRKGMPSSQYEFPGWEDDQIPTAFQAIGIFDQGWTFDGEEPEGSLPSQVSDGGEGVDERVDFPMTPRDVEVVVDEDIMRAVTQRFPSQRASQNATQRSDAEVVGLLDYMADEESNQDMERQYGLMTVDEDAEINAIHGEPATGDEEDAEPEEEEDFGDLSIVYDDRSSSPYGPSPEKGDGRRNDGVPQTPDRVDGRGGEQGSSRAENLGTPRSIFTQRRWILPGTPHTPRDVTPRSTNNAVDEPALSDASSPAKIEHDGSFLKRLLEALLLIDRRELAEPPLRELRFFICPRRHQGLSRLLRRDVWVHLLTSIVAPSSARAIRSPLVFEDEDSLSDVGEDDASDSDAPSSPTPSRPVRRIPQVDGTFDTPPPETPPAKRRKLTNGRDGQGGREDGGSLWDFEDESGRGKGHTGRTEDGKSQLRRQKEWFWSDNSPGTSESFEPADETSEEYISPSPQTRRPQTRNSTSNPSSPHRSRASIDAALAVYRRAREAARQRQQHRKQTVSPSISPSLSPTRPSLPLHRTRNSGIQKHKPRNTFEAVEISSRRHRIRINVATPSKSQGFRIVGLGSARGVGVEGSPRRRGWERTVEYFERRRGGEAGEEGEARGQEGGVSGGRSSAGSAVRSLRDFMRMSEASEEISFGSSGRREDDVVGDEDPQRMQPQPMAIPTLRAPTPPPPPSPVRRKPFVFPKFVLPGRGRGVEGVQDRGPSHGGGRDSFAHNDTLGNKLDIDGFGEDDEVIPLSPPNAMSAPVEDVSPGWGDNDWHGGYEDDMGLEVEDEALVQMMDEVEEEGYDDEDLSDENLLGDETTANSLVQVHADDADHGEDMDIESTDYTDESLTQAPRPSQAMAERVKWSPTAQTSWPSQWISPPRIGSPTDGTVPGAGGRSPGLDRLARSLAGNVKEWRSWGGGLGGRRADDDDEGLGSSDVGLEAGVRMDEGDGEIGQEESHEETFILPVQGRPEVVGHDADGVITNSQADLPASSHADTSAQSQQSKEGVDIPHPHPPSQPNAITHPPSQSSCITSSQPPASQHSNTTTPQTPKPPLRIFRPAHPPPTKAHLLATLQELKVPEVVYTEPHFSKAVDVPKKTRVYAERQFRFEVPGSESLEEFWTGKLGDEVEGEGRRRAKGKGKEVVRENGRNVQPSKIKNWTLAQLPSTRKQVEEWLKRNPLHEEAGGAGPHAGTKRARTQDVSQVEAPTPRNPHGFKFTQVPKAALSVEKDFLNILSVEVHARSRGKLLPDPRKDAVCAIFYCLQTDYEGRYRSNGHLAGFHVGMIMVDDGKGMPKTAVCGYPVDMVPTEKDLFQALVDKVRTFDPDILVGYEIHTSSWGYLIERAGLAYEIELCAELARVKPDKAKTKVGREEDEWGFKKQSALGATGRIFLNVWRLMRSEMNLTSYTMESTVFHVLHQRIPYFSHASCSEWYDHSMLHRWRTVKYYLKRVQYNLELLHTTEMISRTSEFAKVFGIDFFSVLTRGSQFKVESIMARVARPENFIMFSPSRNQVAAMRACECLPLVMEPQSRFYNSPLLVLDFQSLYPSVMIAYNYCYSTCLGRVQSPGKPQKLGVMDDYYIPAEVVERLKDHVNVSPNGVVFVKPHIREGVIRRMLSEILDTRVMVKQSMKRYKGDKALLRVLDARQLGLKFIANVTYGYAGASFSGRMPCVDIADAIVQTGRATLERAIDLIQRTKEWGAKVVYGDTDSLFVYLPGVSKERAFELGKEIVDKITFENPVPVKLKFEKVYHPSVLLAKKRYVGFKYEIMEDKEPTFDAKGIETVRRDGCVAVAKAMEKCLKTQDLSEVKDYLQRLWTKILAGRISIHDFIIAKEIKLGTYSDKGAPQPGALISTKKMADDPRAEPQYGWRVPYVVVHGGPGYRLIDSVVPPEELLNNRTLRLHGTYYITKQIIPALSRIFNLVGADLERWFEEMPKVHRAIQFTTSQRDPGFQPEGERAVRIGGGRTIDQYYVSQHCLVCHELTHKEICNKCLSTPQSTSLRLVQRLNETQRKHNSLQRICRSCTGHSTALDAEVACESLDCPVLFARVKSRGEARLERRLWRGMEALDEAVREGGEGGVEVGYDVNW